MGLKTEEKVLVTALLGAFVHRNERAARGYPLSPFVRIDWRHYMGPRLYYVPAAGGPLELFAAWAGKVLFYKENYCLTREFEITDYHNFNDVSYIFRKVAAGARANSKQLWDNDTFERELTESLFTQTLKGL